MTKTSRTVLVGLLAGIYAGLPCAVQSQTYPAKPVRLIVPYPPGGGSDLMGRMLGEKLQAALGQPLVVENRPGVSGNIGLEFTAKSAPDGYTIVINPNSIAITPALFGSSLDPVRDFSAIIMVSQAPIVIGGHPNLPIKSIGEFVGYAKANPGKLSYASCGAGGLQNIAMEALKTTTGIDVAHVPYNGCGPPIPDMLSGRVPFYASVMNSVSAYLQNGQLRAYGISNAGRSALLPSVPTIAESGFPGFAVDNWIGIFAPAAVPGDVVTRLNGEFNKALSLAEVREKMATQFIEPVGGTPQKLADAVRTDVPRYAKILKEIGIGKPQ